MYFGLIVPAYSYGQFCDHTHHLLLLALTLQKAYFAPSIIQSLGYSPIHTQLLSVPPWACAFALAMISATFSDLLRKRFLFIIPTIAISLTGFIILLVVHDNIHLQYAALFLAAMGTYSAMPIIVCWFSTNRESDPFSLVLQTHNSGLCSWRTSSTCRGHRVADRVRKQCVPTPIATRRTSLTSPSSRRHHRHVLLPLQRRAQIHPRVQHLHRVHRVLLPLVRRVLRERHVGEPQTRQAAGGGRVRPPVRRGEEADGRPRPRLQVLPVVLSRDPIFLQLGLGLGAAVYGMRRMYDNEKYDF